MTGEKGDSSVCILDAVHTSISFTRIEIRAHRLDNTIGFIICRNWIILVDNVYGYVKQLST